MICVFCTSKKEEEWSSFKSSFFLFQDGNDYHRRIIPIITTTTINVRKSVCFWLLVWSSNSQITISEQSSSPLHKEQSRFWSKRKSSCLLSLFDDHLRTITTTTTTMSSSPPPSSSLSLSSSPPPLELLINGPNLGRIFSPWCQRQVVVFFLRFGFLLSLLFEFAAAAGKLF